jgi:outer membrane protein TolC
VNVDEKAAIETALSNRPELISMKQELMIRQVDEDLSAHERLPTLDAFGRYSMSGYGDDLSRAGENIKLNDEDAWEVGLRFEWSIGNRSSRSLHRKKVLKRKQTHAHIKRLKDDIKLEVKQVLHGIETAKGEIEATRRAMEAAEKVVEGEFARFDIGETTNVELLRAQDLLAATSRSFTRAIVNYNVAINELARAQGVLPDGVVLADAGR